MYHIAAPFNSLNFAPSECNVDSHARRSAICRSTLAIKSAYGTRSIPSSTGVDLVVACLLSLPRYSGKITVVAAKITKATESKTMHDSTTKLLLDRVFLSLFAMKTFVIVNRELLMLCSVSHDEIYTLV
jgi:hypothetical protein